jgi:hypothetical protein
MYCDSTQPNRLPLDVRERKAGRVHQFVTLCSIGTTGVNPTRNHGIQGVKLASPPPFIPQTRKTLRGLASLPVALAFAFVRWFVSSPSLRTPAKDTMNMAFGKPI